MTEKQKTYLTEFILGALIAAYVVFLNRNSGHSLVHLLCDGCFVAAVLLLGTGGILFCKEKGAFDIFGYGLRSALGLLVPGVSLMDNGEREDYFTYCERKAAERKKRHQPMLVGFGFLAASLLLRVIYSVAK